MADYTNITKQLREAIERGRVLTLSTAECRQLYSYMSKTDYAGPKPLTETAFLHKRRGELVIERDRARAALTRAYDILALISEECEVGDDGYVRFGSQNDYDTLRDLVSELEADALAEHRSATARDESGSAQ